MEILLFIFPLLSFLIFQFWEKIKKTKLLFVLHSAFMGSTFIISIFIFLKLLNFDNDLPLYFYSILKLEHFLIDWSLRLDLFVSGLIIIITFFATIFTIYLIGVYDENKYDLKIIKNSSLSIFGILTLVSSNNLIQLFVGWQIIIMSSYFLINHSKKQIDTNDKDLMFLYNRLSDLGIFLCLFFLYSYTNSVNFDVIFESNYFEINNKLILLDLEISSFELILFILFLSFLLRCRQFFKQSSIYYFLKNKHSTFALLFSGVYLPAGIYFLLRFLPLIQSSYNFFNIITLLGLIITIIFTLLFYTSRDLRSLVFYIASSQFGIIIFLIGLKAYNGALFYMLTSTLSLTTLFLCFAIIMMKLNGEYQINKMGSLLIKIPSTFLFTLISSLSLIGVPFLSGFYSKNLIFSSVLLLNESFIFFLIMIYFCYIFLLTYTLFKNMLIVFLCQNNCNIHLYNKIDEKMFLTKMILLILAVFLIFLGWFLNNLFSGSNSEYLWNLALNINKDFSLKYEYDTHNWFTILTNIICISSLLLSIFNYVVIPKIGNYVKIKSNKLFKKYSTYLALNS